MPDRQLRAEVRVVDLGAEADAHDRGQLRAAGRHGDRRRLAGQRAGCAAPGRSGRSGPSARCRRRPRTTRPYEPTSCTVLPSLVSVTCTPPVSYGYCTASAVSLPADVRPVAAFAGSIGVVQSPRPATARGREAPHPAERVHVDGARAAELLGRPSRPRRCAHRGTARIVDRRVHDRTRLRECPRPRAWPISCARIFTCQLLNAFGDLQARDAQLHEADAAVAGHRAVGRADVRLLGDGDVGTLTGPRRHEPERRARAVPHREGLCRPASRRWSGCGR